MSTREQPNQETPRDPVLARAYRNAVETEARPAAALDDAIRAAARRAVHAKPAAADGPAQARAPRRWQMPVALAASLALAVGVAIKVYDTGEADIRQNENTARAPMSAPVPAAPSPAQSDAEERQPAPADANKSPATPSAADVQDLAKNAESVASSTKAVTPPAPSQLAPASAAPPRRADEAASNRPMEKERRQERAASQRSSEVHAPTRPAATDSLEERRDADPRVHAEGGGDTASAPVGGAARGLEAPVVLPRAFPGSSPAPAAPEPQAAPASPPPPAVAMSPAAKPAAPLGSASAPEGALRERSAMKVEAPPGPAPPRAFGERLEDRAQGRIAAAPRPEVSRAKQLESRPAQEWIEEIRRLRRAERLTEANELLAEFRKRFPDVELPDDLR